MINNAPAKNLADNTPDDESGEWAVTLYVPYYLPPEPPYHLPAEPEIDGDAGEGWVLTIYEPYCLPAKLEEESQKDEEGSYPL